MRLNKIDILKLLYFLLTLFVNVKSLNIIMSSATLEQVHVIFRHGERGPLKYYENPNFDLIKNGNIWPDGPAQLTNRGKQELYELGSYLRTRYTDLVGKKYVKNEFSCLSSDTDRTIMSAQMVLASFYAPQNIEMNWSKNIAWTPTPCRSIPVKYDAIINEKDEICPKRNDLLKEVFLSKDYGDFTKKYETVLQLVEENSGMSEEDLKDFQNYNNYFDYIILQNLFNISLPDWTLPILKFGPQITEEYRKFKISTPALVRLFTGPLIGKILKDMKSIQNNNVPKFNMYSGHDATITKLINSILEIDHLVIPPFAACLMVELHKENNSYKIQVLYKNDSRIEPHLLKISNCETPCELRTFSEIVKDIIPINWTAECQSEIIKTFEKSFLMNEMWKILLSGGGGFIICLLIVFLLRINRGKKLASNRDDEKLPLLSS